VEKKGRLAQKYTKNFRLGGDGPTRGGRGGTPDGGPGRKKREEGSNQKRTGQGNSPKKRSRKVLWGGPEKKGNKPSRNWKPSKGKGKRILSKHRKMPEPGGVTSHEKQQKPLAPADQGDSRWTRQST